MWWDGAVHAMEDRKVKYQCMWTRTPGTSSSDIAPPVRSYILLPFTLPLAEWFMHSGEKWSCRNDSSNEQTNMHGLCGHLGPYDVQVHIATEGQVWVSGPTTAEVCVDCHGPCYH